MSDRPAAGLTPLSTEARLQGAPLAVEPAALRPVSVAAAIVILAGLLLASVQTYEGGTGAKLSLSLAFGTAFGIVIQRARFCFFCMFRDWYDHRDPRGIFGLLVALGVGLLGYSIVFGAWLPDASSGRLPPDAFIGPVSLALVLAGLAFGAGMAISGSCVSAHLYRLGEGSPTAPFALVGTVIGFIAGFMSWNPLYLAFISGAPVVWLPGWLGYAGTLTLAFLLLGLVAYALTLRSSGPRESASADSPWKRVLVDRWPAWLGGIAVGVLGMASYLRVAPLGVTAELSSQARLAGETLNLMPLRLDGLDTFRGCVTIIRDAALSPNGAFVIAMVLSAFAAALVAGQFRPAWPSGSQILRGLGGGVLLGWGAMIGLGCTVGTLLSGIMAGALSGWVFGAAVFVGIAVMLKIGRPLKLTV
ncbi:MAG TPA: YeeE/YedE family protein [Xanthobacteraceae bacterium]|nr:YeeE/YedE family protein [Xanthobacteraceae bacterium]